MKTHSISTSLDSSYYKETQRINSWLTLMISLTPIIASLVIFSFVEASPEFNDFFLPPILISSLLGVFLFSVQLHTKIDEEGIHYQFSPFHFKVRTILWSKVTELNVKEYKPLYDFGGWGIRFTRVGKVYNLRGKSCLRLEFGDNKGLFIGTQRPEELEECLKSISESSSKYTV